MQRAKVPCLNLTSCEQTASTPGEQVRWMNNKAKEPLSPEIKSLMHSTAVADKVAGPNCTSRSGFLDTPRLLKEVIFICRVYQAVLHAAKTQL